MVSPFLDAKKYSYGKASRPAGNLTEETPGCVVLRHLMLLGRQNRRSSE